MTAISMGNSAVATALVLSGFIGSAAVADQHGWEPVEAHPGYLSRNGWSLSGLTLDGDDMVSMWQLPERVDEAETDFLGNPLRLRAELVRCFETRSDAGVFEITNCERAR